MCILFDFFVFIISADVRAIIITKRARYRRRPTTILYYIIIIVYVCVCY